VQSGNARDERRRGAPDAGVVQVVDLEPALTADEEVSVREGDAALDLAGLQGAEVVLARCTEIADVVDGVRGEDVPAQHVHGRAGTEHAVRRESELRRRRRAVDQRQRTIRLPVIGSQCRSGDEEYRNQSDP
jgi:hypothetical protein